MSARRGKGKKASSKCGSLSYKCHNCAHEVELKLTARGCVTVKTEDEVKNEVKDEVKFSSGVREHAPGPLGTSSLTTLSTSPVVEKKVPSEHGSSTVTHCLPVVVEVRHSGFWITNSEGMHVSTIDEKCERNSVMLEPTCLLYVYKLALRHLLLSRGIITPEDIDPANLVPHVKVRESKNDPFSKYKSIQNELFLLEERSLSAKSDFLTIELDEKLDLHCTMIFSKGLKKRANMVELFKEMIGTLNREPELIKQYSSLPYFGQAAIDYWLETAESYPHNIVPPETWKPTKKINKKEELAKLKLSPAGSIL